jgi:hypothetical protein
VQFKVVKLLELNLVRDGKNPETHFTALAVDRLQDKQVDGKNDVSGRDFVARLVLLHVRKVKGTLEPLDYTEMGLKTCFISVTISTHQDIQTTCVLGGGGGMITCSTSGEMPLVHSSSTTNDGLW